MRRSIVAIPLFLAACIVSSPSRPDFVEPRWGNAPAPLPWEIAEITHEVMHCQVRCWVEAFSMRRDGRATWSYRTNGRLDSLFHASLDSVGYLAFATALARDAAFWGDRSGATWAPLTSAALRTSASAFGRRNVFVYEGMLGKLHWEHVPKSIRAVDSLARRLIWRSCGVDRCVPRPSPPPPASETR